jgi:hypothetical protein
VLGLLAQSRPRPVVKEYYREPACSRVRPRPREIGWNNPIERSLLSIGLKSATTPKEFCQRVLSLVSQEFHSLPREWEKLFCLADPEFLGRDRFGAVLSRVTKIDGLYLRPKRYQNVISVPGNENVIRNSIRVFKRTIPGKTETSLKRVVTTPF